jgi:predicted ATPase
MTEPTSEHPIPLVFSGGSPGSTRLLRPQPHRDNLPTQLTSFIGRTRELQEVRDLLQRESVRLVTLAGPGGAGKTRFALEVAAGLLDDFRDGIFLVDLAPITAPSLLPTLIARVFDVRETGAIPLVESLRAFLRDKMLLLLLDNFEQIVDAAPLVAELLAKCPGLKLLVTSRTMLNLSGEHVYAVPPLQLPDPAQRASLEELSQYEAVRLFIERAQAAKTHFSLTSGNAPAVAEICHQLDGLPLAIELAAARIRLLPPEALLSRLKDRLKLLTGGARDRPERQQTLRNTIAWSYDLLSAAEQAFFRRLSVFVGGFTLEAAEAVCDPAGELGLDLLDGVASLVDKSLLTHGEGLEGEPRFFMLETIREFAGNELTARNEAETLRQQHEAYFVALVEAAGPRLRSGAQARWLGRLEHERSNLRMAQLRALRTAAEGIRPLEPLVFFWWLRGHSTEEQRWLVQVLALPDAAAPTAIRARVLYLAGVLAWTKTEYAEACRLLEESAGIWRQLAEDGLPDPSHYAYTLAWLSISMAHSLTLPRQSARGNEDFIRSAQRRSEEAITRLRALGDVWGTAFALVCKGFVLRASGNEQAARSCFEESRALFQTTGDRWWRDIAVFHLGRSAFTLRDNQTARACWLAVLPTFRLFGDKHHIAGMLSVLALLARYDQDGVRAAILFGAEVMVRETFAAPLAPGYQRLSDRAAATVRAMIGDAAFEAGWATGRA